MAEPDTNIIDTVREYAAEVEADKQKLKTMRERQTEIIESKNAFSDLEEAKEALAAAKQNLKSALLQDSEYNDLTENIADQKEKIKDSKEILSSYLLEHYRSTGEKQIELGDHGDAREVILIGKLGREQKYQTSMFVGGDHEGN